MKKSIFLFCFLPVLMFCQVGINNASPKATLDVTAQTFDGSQPEGFIAPRLTGDQIKAKDAQYTAAQQGTFVYATSAVTTASLKTGNIVGAGYYYFDGSTWQRVINSRSTLSSISLVASPPSVPINADASNTVNTSFFQQFDTVLANPSNAFDVSTGTFTAPRTGNYLISGFILPNCPPRRFGTSFYYPLNLQIRKNVTPGDPTSGSNIMESVLIRWGTPASGGSNTVLRFTTSVTGMVTLAAGERINLVIYLYGPMEVDPAATGGISFPSFFSYAPVGTYRAQFSVTEL